jgi:hypothetical protein
MVICLSCKPVLPALLKVTLITPLSPGLTGVLGHSGVVQPQLAYRIGNNQRRFAIVGEFKIVTNLIALFDFAKIMAFFFKLH